MIIIINNNKYEEEVKKKKMSVKTINQIFLNLLSLLTYFFFLEILMVEQLI